MAKKSARKVSPQSVTGVPSPSPSAGSAKVVKRIVQGGGKTKGLGGGKDK